MTEGAALESWVQCDACGKWREVSKGALRALAAQGEHDLAVVHQVGLGFFQESIKVKRA